MSVGVGRARVGTGAVEAGIGLASAELAAVDVDAIGVRGGEAGGRDGVVASGLADTVDGETATGDVVEVALVSRVEAALLFPVPALPSPSRCPCPTNPEFTMGSAEPVSKDAAVAAAASERYVLSTSMV